MEGKRNINCTIWREIKNTGKLNVSAKTFAERVAAIPKDINAIRRGNRLGTGIHKRVPSDTE